MTSNRRTGRCRRLAAASAIALAVAVAYAAPASAIDLAQMYELALVNDGQLKAARARADGGREVLPQATAQVLPNVSFSYGYGHTEQDRSLGGLTQPTARYPTENYSLSLKQSLYRQVQFSQLSQAKSKVAGVDAQLDKDTQSLGSRLVNAYFSALFARDSLDLIQAQKASYEAQLRAAKLAFQAGSGTRTDIDDVQAKYDVLLAEEIRARQAINSSTLQLEIYIGQKIDSLALLDPKRFVAEAHEPGRLQEWIDRALQYSPDVRQLKATWDAAVKGIEIAKSGHLPTVDLVAQRAYSKGDSTQTIPQTQNTTSYIGVQIAVPIFSGGYTESGVRQSIAQADEAREAYEYARDDLRLKVQQQFDAVQAGIARVVALERALISAEQNVVSNRKGVQAGTRTTLDVLTVEQQRFNTQVDLAKARYQVIVDWSSLLAFAGDLDAEQIARLNRVLKG